MFHYTNSTGYNKIRAQQVWLFLAAQPPGDHPFGAYFTTLDPTTPKLAKKLLIPREKLGYVFSFVDIGDLQRLRGGRGEFVLFSSVDYPVSENRQLQHGETGL